MKRMWVALALFVLTVAACVVGITYTQNITAKMTETVSQAKAAQKRGDVDAACKLSEQAKSEWKEAHRLLCVYMVHDRLEEIDVTLAAMPELCRNGAEEEFLSECDRGLMQISYLNESEIPNLENIF
jgi:acyl-CoA reductase-like NAD-dependent aldehyde dehydrogenase